MQNGIQLRPLWNYIKDLYTEAGYTRCHAREGYRTWVGKVILTCPTVAAADGYQCRIYGCQLQTIQTY